MITRFIIITITLLPCLVSAQTTGMFGGNWTASGHANPGNTTNKWIKIAEMTLNGPYNPAGFTMDLFPRNSNHGDGQEQLNVQFRNNSSTGIYTTSNDITLIHFHGQHKTIKDVKVIHTAGTAITNNKLSVWVQMGISWLYNVPIEVRAYGNITVQTTNQPYHSAITESGVTYGNVLRNG